MKKGKFILDNIPRILKFQMKKETNFIIGGFVTGHPGPL